MTATSLSSADPPLRMSQLYEVLRGYASTLEIRHMIEECIDKKAAAAGESSTSAAAAHSEGQTEGIDKEALFDFVQLCVEEEWARREQRREERLRHLPPLAPQRRYMDDEEEEYHDASGSGGLETAVAALTQRVQDMEDEVVAMRQQQRLLWAAISGREEEAEGHSAVDGRPSLHSLATAVRLWEDALGAGQVDTVRELWREAVQAATGGVQQTPGRRQQQEIPMETPPRYGSSSLRCSPSKQTNLSHRSSSGGSGRGVELGIDALDVPPGSIDSRLRRAFPSPASPTARWLGCGGVRVLAVDEDSIAQAVGIQSGDVILSTLRFGPVESCGALKAAMGQMSGKGHQQPYDVVTVFRSRTGEIHTLELVF